MFLCVVGASGAHSQSEGGAQQSQAGNQTDAQHWPGTKDSLRYRVDCNNAENREDADYCEEWKSANAAKEQANWALGQLIVGTLGVFAVVATLIYTARAASAAQRSAETAEKAIMGSDAVFEHSRASSERELQAYTGAWPPAKGAIFNFCDTGNETDETG